MDFASQRRPYSRGSLGDDARTADPLATLSAWMQAAYEDGDKESNVMALATIDPDGGPVVRYVLCKGVTERGIRFFTNTESRKGESLDADPRAAVTFWWPGPERSARVVGVAEPLSRADVDEYFAGRPRGSRLGAWVSDQSRPVADRPALEARAAEIEARFTDPEPLEAPAFWGGYEIVATEVELWQGRDDRLHDRLQFTRSTDDPDTGETGWSVERLQP